MNDKPQETIGANEPAIMAEIVSGTIADQERDYKPGTLARRDVHSKSHGTFDDATFQVRPDILIGCQTGLFAERGKVYPATVRLSNGAPGVGPDALPNVRGIAIKVRTVPGAKLLVGDEASDCCDFLLANHPVSFHRHLEDYPEIRALMAKGKVGEVLKRFKPEGRLLLKAVLSWSRTRSRWPTTRRRPTSSAMVAWSNTHSSPSGVVGSLRSSTSSRCPTSSTGLICVTQLRRPCASGR